MLLGSLPLTLLPLELFVYGWPMLLAPALICFALLSSHPLFPMFCLGRCIFCFLFKLLFLNTCIQCNVYPKNRKRKRKFQLMVISFHPYIWFFLLSLRQLRGFQNFFGKMGKYLYFQKSNYIHFKLLSLTNANYRCSKFLTKLQMI